MSAGGLMSASEKRKRKRVLIELDAFDIDFILSSISENTLESERTEQEAQTTDKIERAQRRLRT